jgi:hypothetical protein
MIGIKYFTFRFRSIGDQRHNSNSKWETGLKQVFLNIAVNKWFKVNEV